MDLLVGLIEQFALVISSIGATFIVAYRHAMVVCLRKFSAQSDVINSRRISAKIGWKAERQMMDARELNDSEKKSYRLLSLLSSKIELKMYIYFVEYSISPVGSRCSSNS